MKQKYLSKKFTRASEKLLATIDKIMRDYASQGYVLTVRQLYYQLVAMAIIPNSERSYKSITGLVKDGRECGWLDWEGIEDRTRAFTSRPHWESGPDFLEAVLPQFFMDLWANQRVRPYVIVEKEALAGVMSRICSQYDVPLLAARGYPSVSVIRDWCKYTLIPVYEGGQEVMILHFGDHDPSGIDMTRDLQTRIECFSEGYGYPDFRRVALNMSQIDEQQPPPNQAKTTDSRFQEYSELYGDESWELDALKPAYLVNLIKTNFEDVIDPEAWNTKLQEIEAIKQRLEVLHKNY